MRIAPDTNLLLRVVLRDDPAQCLRAEAALREAEEVDISFVTLCEFVWVLQRQLRWSRPDIASAIRTFISAPNVRCYRPTIEVGLDVLEAGGDFADAVIAYDGAWLGADEFVSFDRAAVERLQAQGHPARLL